MSIFDWLFLLAVFGGAVASAFNRSPPSRWNDYPTQRMRQDEALRASLRDDRWTSRGTDI